MRARLVVATCAFACLAVPATALAAPSAQTQAPTDVTATSVTLQGLVNPADKPTTYWFELGTTTAYGTATSPRSMAKANKPVAVTTAVADLQPGMQYHARVVAKVDKATLTGADVTFTTAAVPQDAGALPSAPGEALPVPQDTVPSLAPAATPELGHSATVATGDGAVLVRLPGAASPVALRDVAQVPVGSTIDTRHGSVDLTTELPGGSTQTGRFHGGIFEVRQPIGGRGMTELVLRGPRPVCRARAAVAGTKRPPRSLWGKDQHGRFRTRASNSVVTVRGTEWYVADRCDGTLTRVTKGAVSVRDLKAKRTVLVRAGHSYLARNQ